MPRSTSVGDVLVTPEGVAYVVDDFGFTDRSRPCRPRGDPLRPGRDADVTRGERDQSLKHVHHRSGDIALNVKAGLDHEGLLAAVGGRDIEAHPVGAEIGDGEWREGPRATCAGRRGRVVGVPVSPDRHRVAVRRALNHVARSPGPDRVDHIDEFALAIDDEGSALAALQLQRLETKPVGVEVEEVQVRFIP